ncbi:MAG: hypothetical protein EXS37_00385 [Opitutus sp.]|nr:hypothetical protein [Opitutus sp.]
MGVAPDSEELGQVRQGISGGVAWFSRRWKLALLAIAVVGSNGVTAWLLTRPPPPLPPELLPEYRLVTPEQAERVLAEFAGDFETGADAGDRGLTISPEGGLRSVVWGPDRTLAEETKLTARAAESRGRPVLVTNNYGMIEMKDPVTVVYFGDTYRRKKP